MGFRIGQRVRIVMSNCPETDFLVGMEGTVASTEEERLDIFGENPSMCQFVDVDGVEDGGEEWGWGFESNELSPIAPEGHKVVSWSECLWMPEHMREQA